jgi:SET domain-containing protein
MVQPSTPPKQGLAARIVTDTPSKIVPDALDMWEQYPRLALELRHFGRKGRGVVAVEDIPRGALIERSPVVVVPAEIWPRVSNSILLTYVFMWEENAGDQDLYKGEGRVALPLGFATLINHSPAANARCVPHIDRFAMDVVALRDIGAGEEITVEYKMDLWFDPS